MIKNDAQQQTGGLRAAFTFLGAHEMKEYTGVDLIDRMFNDAKPRTVANEDELQGTDENSES